MCGRDLGGWVQQNRRRVVVTVVDEEGSREV